VHFDGHGDSTGFWLPVSMMMMKMILMMIALMLVMVPIVVRAADVDI